MSDVSPPVQTVSTSPATVDISQLLQRFFLAAVFVIASFLALPILVLFVATAVPRLIAGILLVVYGLAVFLTLSMPLPVLAILGLPVLSLIAVWLSQKFASTPPIVDVQGQPIAGSIATLEPLQLGGVTQWISVRAQDAKKPVLLYLAGGPGGSDLAWLRTYCGALEQHFVVVNWEQRGTGKSYRGVDHAHLTAEHYLADAHELTQYLCKRFGQAKIYLMGHSWGSFIGVQLAQRHPELFHAYLGVGQAVNFLQSSQLGYDLALRYAQDKGEKAAVTLLQKRGAPPYTAKNVALAHVPYSRFLVRYMAEKATGENGAGRPNFTLTLLAGVEYGLRDKLDVIQGAEKAFNQVYPQVEAVDLREVAPCLDLPVYFFMGRWDVNSMASLTQAYFDKLQAPRKALIWFEQSGHLPHYEEPQAFVEAVRTRVLNSA